MWGCPGARRLRLGGRRGAAAFLSHFTVFILACVVGYYVVWNVSHALHAADVGHQCHLRHHRGRCAVADWTGRPGSSALAFVAVLIATINIFGGFTVTQRMLKMFRKGLRGLTCLMDW